MTHRYTAYAATGFSAAALLEGINTLVGFLFALCTIVSTVISITSLVVQMVKKTKKAKEDGKIDAAEIFDIVATAEEIAKEIENNIQKGGDHNGKP